MAKLGIIADDLSGACDSAAEFASRNFASFVDLQNEIDLVEQAEILAVSTETRNESPDKAAAGVVEVFDRLRLAGVHYIYKKVDSTLRGNCRVEIDALLSAGPFDRALIVPAFPETGRYVRSGLLFMGDDPSSPVHIPTVLGERDLQCIAVDECDADRVLGNGLFVVETSNREELRQAAQTLWKRRTGTLLVGSAGLAAEIAELMQGEAAAPKIMPTVRFPVSARPLIFVVGSNHIQTGTQMSVLKRHRQIACIGLEEQWDLSARGILAAKRDIALLLDCDAFDFSHLSKLRNLVKDGLCSALVATGGFTARLVCEALGARAIRILGNLLPGIALGSLIGSDVEGLPFVTKSGGFGDDDALTRIARLLRDEEAA